MAVNSSHAWRYAASWASSPAAMSRNSRCLAADAIRSCSLCPCTVMSSPATLSNTERGTVLPPSTARERPDAGTTRERNSSPSSGVTPASSAYCTALPAGLSVPTAFAVPETPEIPESPGTQNTPCAHASPAPADTRDPDAAPPEISRMAESSMDFPAPVSPVMAVNPGAGAICASRIGPRLRTESSSSISGHSSWRSQCRNRSAHRVGHHWPSLHRAPTCCDSRVRASRPPEDRIC